MSARHFGRLPGDFATYSLNDADGAVRLAKTAPVVAMDIETGSAATVNRWTIKAFSISDTSQAHVLDPELHADAIRECIREARTMVFHGAAYDVPILYANDMIRAVDIARVEDTLILARLTWPDSFAASNKLGPLADRVLGDGYGHLKTALEDGFKAVNPTLSKSAMFDQLGIDSQAYVAYSAFDSIITARLYGALPGRLASALNPGLPGFRPVDAAHIAAREQTVNRLLLRRSSIGIVLDDEAADDVVEELQHEATVQRAVLASHGIDPDQSGADIKRQLVAALDAAGKLPSSWPRLKSGLPTTNKDWMARLEDSPVAEAAVAMARAERFVKDYRGGSAELSYRGRIRPQVSVQAAVTGRMSYSRPALQQYPGAVRRMFAFDQPITSFDWSSIEPVVIANLAHASGMLAEFESGGDLYQPIADAAGIARQSAKVVLLAMLYGQGVASLALRLGVPEEEARQLQTSLKAAMPEVTEAIRRLTAYGNQYGAIQTISGRVIPLPKDPRSGNKRFMGYKSTNFLIQGSALDLLSEAIYSMHLAGLGDALCLAIHDELIVYTEVAADVERIMLTPPPALVEAAGRVPVLRVGRTDLGLNWSVKS
jgi:DNA polymerase I